MRLAGKESEKEDGLQRSFLQERKNYKISQIKREKLAKKMKQWENEINFL